VKPHCDSADRNRDNSNGFDPSETRRAVVIVGPDGISSLHLFHMRHRAPYFR
jgi:hypothetical protein